MSKQGMTDGGWTISPTVENLENFNDISWYQDKNPPASDKNKLWLIKSLYEDLKKDPERTVVSRTIFGTCITLVVEDDYYWVYERNEKQYAFLDRDLLKDPLRCKCKSDILHSRGCQCGGI